MKVIKSAVCRSASGRKISVSLYELDGGTPDGGILVARQAGDVIWRFAPDDPDDQVVNFHAATDGVRVWTRNEDFYLLSPEGGAVLNGEDGDGG